MWHALAVLSLVLLGTMRKTQGDTPLPCPLSTVISHDEVSSNDEPCGISRTVD